MKQPDTHWERCGTRGVGVLVSDTMMFQRGEPSPGDPHLGSFYGLALPLLKHGVPVEPVQIESATKPGFLDAYRLLFLTYEGQKPLSADFHDALAAWVRKGGALVVVDDDSDPYNAVREWWNTEPNHFRGPREHLFKTLGLDSDARGVSRIGEGVLLREAASPAALTYEKDGAERVRALARKSAEMVKLAWSETNALVLRRGPFIIAAALDESLPMPVRCIDRPLRGFVRCPVADCLRSQAGARPPHAPSRPEHRGKIGRHAAHCSRRVPDSRRDHDAGTAHIPRRRDCREQWRSMHPLTPRAIIREHG